MLQARIAVDEGETVFITVRGGIVTLKQGSDIIRLPYSAAGEMAGDVRDLVLEATRVEVAS